MHEWVPAGRHPVVLFFSRKPDFVPPKNCLAFHMDNEYKDLLCFFLPRKITPKMSRRHKNVLPPQSTSRYPRSFLLPIFSIHVAVIECYFAESVLFLIELNQKRFPNVFDFKTKQDNFINVFKGAQTTRRSDSALPQLDVDAVFPRFFLTKVWLRV